ncbi:MAG TPA: hypothetical protein VFQ67_06540 [Allosphingosinicella sp.]|jgi:hypothetical protein|nr:hypothetical protein [Allosphingosinicella sp.]
MAEIDDYIEVMFFIEFPKFSLPERWARRGELVPLIKTGLDAMLMDYDERLRSNNPILAEIYFDKLLTAGVFSETTDRFAGAYYHYNSGSVGRARDDFLSRSVIYSQSMAIGRRFFPDVFSGYLGLSDIEELPVPNNVEVPASDRIVTLSHNQLKEIEPPLDELISALEADNGLPDQPGLKERLLGQVRAGRELLRVGSFKAYLVYITLLAGLAHLIEKYKGHAIAAAATTLMELLIKHVFEIA